MAWAGWGAGAAGAGAAGGPSRLFLGAACLGAVVITAVLALEGTATALLSGAAAVYFGLRFAGRLGPKDPT
jgi:hypothetical protein